MPRVSISLWASIVDRVLGLGPRLGLMVGKDKDQVYHERLLKLLAALADQYANSQSAGDIHCV